MPTNFMIKPATVILENLLTLLYFIRIKGLNVN